MIDFTGNNFLALKPRRSQETYGPAVEIGAKVEAVYLACAALSIRCLARMSFDPKAVRKALHLTAGQRPLCAQTLGYKPTSLFNIAL